MLHDIFCQSVRVGTASSLTRRALARMALARRHARMRMFLLPPVWRGMLWVAASGVVFTLLNTIVRNITLSLDPFQALFLRYLAGTLVILPLVLRQGYAAYRPVNMAGQWWRGAVHTLGLVFWFTALPRIGLADMTAIGFTGPIFIMIGAAWFLGEKMYADRWIAALFGFAGVLVVVGPHLSASGGIYFLVMLASSPLFAASFLMTKSLTHTESAGAIVLWQAISVTALSLPLGLLNWTDPTLMQWLGFLAAGILGSGAHYLLTRGFRVADISATQTLRFLDLIWASLMGWLVFSDVPSHSTILGAMVILASTVWIAQRERGR